MALTTDQLSDMQMDLGITNDQAVFTDTELNRLFERAESNYDKAVYFGWRVLLADTAKFFNYTAGQTRVERAVMFDHVKAMVDYWQKISQTTDNQLAILGLNEIPTKHKEIPYEDLQNVRRKRFLGGWRVR